MLGEQPVEADEEVVAAAAARDRAALSPVSSGATDSIAAVFSARASASRNDSQWKLDSVARHEMK